VSLLNKITGLFAFRSNPKQRATDHMAGHPSLDDEQFGSTYFAAGRDAKIAIRLRHILADHLPVDISRLHPDDNLIREIQMDSNR
jgi:hypothetical protein